MSSSLSIVISSPAGGVAAPPVTISYTLMSASSNPANIQVQWSNDGGATYQTANAAALRPGDGLTNLSTTPAGQQHTFVWDAASDLNHHSAPAVLIQIGATDTVNGDIGSATSAQFAVNTPPTISVSAPSGGGVQPPVLITYFLADAESDPVDIVVSFSTDSGRSWLTTHEAPGRGSEGTTGLAAVPRPGAVKHLFVWDAASDLHGASAANITIRIVTSDSRPGGIGFSQPFSVDTPPSVRIASVTPAAWPAPVAINYVLTDAESDPARIEVSYSIDLGATFRPATMAAAPAGDGITNLSSSPAGVPHTFEWDAAADLQGNAAVAIVRIASFDLMPGGVDTWAPARFGPPLTATGSRAVPSVQVIQPPDDFGPQIPIHFVISSPDSQPANVTVQWSSGGRFSQAARAANSDRVTNIPAPAIGADYRFLWDAHSDDAPKGPVTLRLTASNATAASAPVEVSFSASPAPIPPATEYTDPLLTPLGGIQLASGTPADQTGMSGQYLPQSLAVHVVDTNQADVPGIRVNFVVTQGGDLFTLDRDLLFSTTTDRSGVAAVRVRAKPGKTGRGGVEAHILGIPSAMTNMKVAFTFTIAQPQIVVTYPFGTPLTPSLDFGVGPTLGVFAIYYNGDGNTFGNSGYWPEPQRPVRLAVQSTGVSTPAWLYPGATVAGCPLRGQAATLVITNPSDPTATAVTVQVPAIPLRSGPDRITGGNPMAFQTEAVGLNLQAFDPAADTLTGISGCTLAASLRLTLTDKNGKPYNYRVDPANETISGPDGPQFDVPPPTFEQNLHYTVIGGGTLSTSQSGAGGLTDLPATISQDVYFTPAGPGPWRVYVQVAAPIYDGDAVLPTSKKVSWKWSDVIAGGSQVLMSQRNWALMDTGGSQVLDYWFFISPPQAAFLTAASPRTPINEVKAGDRVVLQVKASPCSAGQATVQIEALNAGPAGFLGYAPSAYTGMPRPWFQSIALAGDSSGLQTSAEILVVAGSPAIVQTSPVIQPVIPGGWLHAFSDCLETWVGVRRRHVERRSVNGEESLLESPVGTSPRGGVAGSVLLHNGEFLHDARDLSFATASGEVSLTRRYRSHSISTEGPLGSGWQISMLPALDVSAWASNSVRWFDGAGRWDDYFTGYPSSASSAAAPRGSLVMFRATPSIDDDNSPYILYDAHSNEMHFDTDGSIRFLKDRRGYRTRYTFDESLQLTKITDPHGRSVVLSYVGGKLMHVEGIATGHIVDYTYYPPGSASPGWLWTVTWAASSTVLSGGKAGADPAADYRRSETYTYQVDPNNPSDGFLATIADSEGNVLVTNHYDGQNRIMKQDAGPTSFTFDYTTPLTTKLTKRGGASIDYVFPIAPYPVSAAPVTYHDELQNAWTFQHNADGRLLQQTTPAGDGIAYVYDYFGFSGLGHDTLSFPFPRQNAITMRRTSATGRQRVWTYQYDPTWNYVAKAVEPRGNAVGVNPNLFAVRYTYDQTTGNLLTVTRPPAARAVVAADGSIAWRLDAQESWEYNKNGQEFRHHDALGVVTEFSHFALKSPLSGPVDPDGGGFLASRGRDVAGNAARDANLPGVAVQTISTQWRYDSLGHISQFQENAGHVTFVETSALHEVTKVTIPSDAPLGAQPPTIEQTFAHDPRGNIAQHRVHQPGASADLGGEYPFREMWTDPYGRPTDSWSTVSADVAHDTFEHDSDGRFTGYFSADVVAPYADPSLPPLPAAAGSVIGDQSGVRMARDPRGLPSQMLAGVAPGSGSTGSALLNTTCTWTTDGQPASATPAGAPAPFTSYLDDFGAVYGSVDPHGNISHTLYDDTGAPTRGMSRQGEHTPNEQTRAVMPAADAARPMTATEVCTDSAGLVRRVHRAFFVPDQPGSAGTPLPAAPEYLPAPAGIGTTDWPPACGALIDNGGWGPGDGRSTTDIAYDGRGLAARCASDTQTTVTIRRDAHGRPLDLWIHGGDSSAPAAQIRHATYSRDAAGNVSDVSVTDSATDPAQPALICLGKADYDAAGRRIRNIDGEGNAHRIEFDQMSHAYVSFDAMGPDSAESYNGWPVNADGNKTTFKRDARGRVTGYELTLTVDGTSATPQDFSNTYNLSGTITAKTAYSRDGRVILFTDHVGHPTRWGYDGYGRPQSVNYDSAPSLGGVTRALRDYHPGSGLLWHTTDANGSIVEHTWDGLGRLTKIQGVTLGPGAGPAGYAWSYQGSHVVATDLLTGRVVDQATDSLGGMRVELQGGVAVTRKLDGVGHLLSLTYPSGAQTDFIRDTAGRLRQVLDRGQEIARFDYSGPARETRRVQGPVSTTYVYRPGSGRFMEMALAGLTWPSTGMAPAATIVSPVGSAPASPVRLRYVLYDLQSRALDIMVQFSLDGGATWAAATEAAAPAARAKAHWRRAPPVARTSSPGTPPRTYPQARLPRLPASASR